MTPYLAIPCPHCQRLLQVRAEYRGRRVACRYCEQSFLITSDDNPPATVPAPVEPQPVRQRIAQREAEFPQLRQELAMRSSDHSTLTLRLQEAQEEITRLRTSQHDLQEQLEQAHQRTREAETRLQETQTVLEELRKRTQFLEEQAARADGLNRELQQSREELVKVQSEREKDRATHRIDQAAAEAAARELRTVREEYSQLQEELRRVHAELHARLADGKRLEHLTEEFELLQTAREQLRSCVADQERSLAEAETARARAVCDLDEARQEWHKERGELRTDIEQLCHERDDLAERVREINTEHRQAVEQRQAEIHELTVALAQAQQRQEAAASHQAATEEELRTFRAERDEQQQREIDLRQCLGLLEQERVTERESLTRALAEQQHRVEELEARLQQEESARQQAETLAVQLDALQEELEPQRAQIADLQRRLSVAERELEVTRAECERLGLVLNEEQALSAREREQGQQRLVAAQQEFEQEREGLRQQTEVLRVRVTSLQQALNGCGVYVY